MNYYTLGSTKTFLSLQLLILFLLMPLSAFALDKTSTGFFYPTGSNTWPATGGNWLSRDAAHGGGYVSGYYHIAQDMLKPLGSNVYAISDGDVVKIYTTDSNDDYGIGTGNSVIFIRHTLQDGTQFLAEYMHVRPTIHEGDHIYGGNVIAQVGPYQYDVPHLHFGIHPSLNVPTTNWGRMPNSAWAGTNGFVDPVNYIQTHSPYGSSSTGGSNPSPADIRAKLVAAGQKWQIPPHILFGIAWQESGWRQFDSNGNTVISGDGGIGIMQLTGATAAQFDVNRLKTDIDYNIDSGAKVLNDKWNSTPYIGDNDRAKLENWYYSIWAYNSFGSVNNPNLNSNPYQHRVIGIIANCPNGQWQSCQITEPALSLIGNPPGNIANTPAPIHVDANFDGIIDSNDTTPPNVTITSGQASGGIYNSPQRVTWHIDDNGGSGLKSWGQSWDSDPGYSPFTTNDGYLDLPTGTHTLNIDVIDNAGNHKDWTFGPYTYNPVAQVGQKSDGTIDQRFVDCYNRVGASVVGSVWNNNTVHTATGNGSGDGSAQDFTDANNAHNIIIAKDDAAKAYDVSGNTWGWYAGQSFASGSAGFPNGDSQQITASTGGFDTAGTVQTFEGGWVYDSKYGTHKIPQAMMSSMSLATVVKIINGTFGFPTSDEQTATPSPQGTTGTVVHFENGVICSTAKYGVHGVYGDIFQKYAAVGGSGSQYGFPISDPYVYKSGTRQDFEGGSLTSGVNAATHILWNNTSGAASIWNDSTADGTYSHREYGPYADYTAKAIADGGTDGKTRVLWNKIDGSVSLWSLDNSAGQFTHAEFGPFAGYTATALSVGTDNTTHILWDNTKGNVSVWNYTAGSYTHHEYGPYPGWTAKALADGPDGKTRLLWDNSDGRMSLWSLDNAAGTYTQNTFGPFAGWTAGSVSVAADNTTHVVWTNTSGMTSVWNYDTGSSIFGQISYGPYGGWSTAAVADTSDGHQCLLWVNTSGAVSLWSLDNSSGQFTQHTYGPYAGWTATAVAAGP